MGTASISIRLCDFPAGATCETNGGVKCVLEKQASQQCAKKQKRYTNFPDTDRAEID